MGYLKRNRSGAKAWDWEWDMNSSPTFAEDIRGCVHP